VGTGQGYGKFELSLELPRELAETMAKIYEFNHSTKIVML